MARGQYEAPSLTDKELIRELGRRLTYLRERGEFRWRKGVNGVAPGSLLGCDSGSGKRQAVFLGKRYQVDALVWLFETGRLPKGPITRKNLDKADHRFSNLVLGRKPAEVDRAALAAAFIAKARERFGDEHAPALVAYVNADTRVELVCRRHGPFSRTPDSYLASPHGCPTCSAHAAVALCSKTYEERTATRRAYRDKNRELYRAAQRKHYRTCKDDPLKRAGRVCRDLLRRVLEASTGRKKGPTQAYLGYSFEELKAHIEAQFTEGMTWANHGEWQVDHILPLDWMVRHGITDPSVVNALSNLRPMFAEANRRKKNSLLRGTYTPLPLWTHVRLAVEAKCA